MSFVIPDSTGALFRIDVGADASPSPFAITQVSAAIAGATSLVSSTYTVSDALKLARAMAKGVPLSGIDLTICNMVSAGIYKSYPWRDTLRIFTPGLYPLVDGQQDYVVSQTDIMRVTQFWLARTDVSPQLYRDITVGKNIPFDLVPTSPNQIRRASYQAGVNAIRLEKAVKVPTGATYEVGGEYQPHPTKLTDLQDTLWFADEYLEVFALGLTYWAYRNADDKRAGEAVKIGDGRVQYSGQLAMFMDAVQKMQEAEDFGNVEGYFPDDSIGSVDGRKWYGSDLYFYILG